MYSLRKMDIEEKLSRIGISADWIGSKYIADYTMLSFNDGMEDAFAAIVYQRISEINKTAPENVEGAIRHAMERARKNQKSKRLASYYFGKDNTTKSSLMHFMRMLKYDLDDAVASVVPEVLV